MSERYNTVLPPKEFWAFDPREKPEQKIYTPLNERGLVDVPNLIKAIRSTIDPEYIWFNATNDHHLFWEAEDYPYSPGTPGNPGLFRNLAINKLRAPLDFHGWLHEVTYEPPVPSPEVRAYRIEAWRVARSLFEKARDTTITTKRTRRRRARHKADPASLVTKTIFIAKNTWLASMKLTSADSVCT